MLVGYARTSTLDQKAGLEAQHRDLDAVGCERIFTEQVSSVDAVRREQLLEALSFVRHGDRLARSVAHLMEILGQLEAKGVALRILSMGIDTNTPTGKLMLTILGGVAQFEREVMLERQREGIAKAKAEGKYKGRAPTARAKADEVLRLHKAGVGATEISKQLGIGRASVYRLLTS
jgi:DNA invertase Pin-like site-specific DNA recombinase